MEPEEAIFFLREHQPMPPDGELTEDLARKYDEVRRYFISHPNADAVPLFLNSFGEGTGLGVYQRVLDVFRALPSGVVVPCLKAALVSPRRSVRRWTAQFAMDYPDVDLVGPLGALLDPTANDGDVREVATAALGFIADERARRILTDVAANDPDGEVRAAAREALDEAWS
jgi:hypothetical protein